MAEVLGVARSYAGLRKLVAMRRRELRLSQLAVDDMAGLQSGYTSKLECGDRCFGDMSLGAIMGALGLEIVLQVLCVAAASLRSASWVCWRTELVPVVKIVAIVLLSGERSVASAVIVETTPFLLL